jgi:hypothetical protein
LEGRTRREEQARSEGGSTRAKALVEAGRGARKDVESWVEVGTAAEVRMRGVGKMDPSGGHEMDDDDDGRREGSKGAIEITSPFLSTMTSPPSPQDIQVTRLQELLKAAEDEILRMRCEVMGGKEGIWTRKEDRAGLRERVEGGEGKGLWTSCLAQSFICEPFGIIYLAGVRPIF